MISDGINQTIKDNFYNMITIVITNMIIIVVVIKVSIKFSITISDETNTSIKD